MIASLNVMRWGDPSAPKTVVALHDVMQARGLALIEFVHQLAHLLRASFRPRLAAIALAHR
jgi:hypothetical protein